MLSTVKKNLTIPGNAGIASSLCVIEKYFLALCTQNLVTLDELMASKKLQSLLFSLKKLFFGTRLSSVAETTIFHLGSQNLVCTISIHIPTHSKKSFALAQPGRWQF